LGVAGALSLAASGASASIDPARDIPTENTAPVITLGEEEISDSQPGDFLCLRQGKRRSTSSRRTACCQRKYIADLQEDWEKHGKAALAEYREKFVDRYVENYAMLARVIRLEADVKHTVAKPRTIAEALDELEGKVGKDGRKKFEKFLRSMGEELDDEDDLIDVESK
jgi:hypothetical protein